MDCLAEGRLGIGLVNQGSSAGKHPAVHATRRSRRPPTAIPKLSVLETPEFGQGRMPTGVLETAAGRHAEQRSRRGGHVRLEPRNPAYEPIDGDEAVVLGKVVSVLRRT